MEEIRILKKMEDIHEIITMLKSKGASVEGSAFKAQASIESKLGDFSFSWQLDERKLSIELLKKPTLIPKGIIISYLDDFLRPWLDLNR